MTHVFVAPHPDDVALSCGGLIASLRELGQNITIITVFSGDGVVRPADGVPARGARLRVEDDVAGDRGVQPQRHPGRLADRRPRPVVGRRRGPPRGDPGRRRCGRQALLAALVVVPAGEHPQRVAGRPAGHRRPADAGRRLHRRGHRRGRRRRADGPPPASRTSGSPTSPRRRSSSSTCPTRSSAATRATTSCSARHAPTTTAPFELLRREIARLEPQKVYLPLGVGGHVDHQLCRDVGVGLLREGRRWVMPGPDYAGIVTFYEDFPYAWWNDFRGLDDLGPARVRGPARRRQHRPDVRRHHRPARAQDHRHHACTRASSSGCSTARVRWPMRSAPTAGRSRSSATVDGSAERYWASGPRLSR